MSREPVGDELVVVVAVFVKEARGGAARRGPADMTAVTGAATTEHRGRSRGRDRRKAQGGCDVQASDRATPDTRACPRDRRSDAFVLSTM
jgi:hypothetical protein